VKQVCPSQIKGRGRYTGSHRHSDFSTSVAEHISSYRVVAPSAKRTLQFRLGIGNVIIFVCTFYLYFFMFCNATDNFDVGGDGEF
jgi:hypothetical protein